MKTFFDHLVHIELNGSSISSDGLVQVTGGTGGGGAGGSVSTYASISSLFHGF